MHETKTRLACGKAEEGARGGQAEAGACVEGASVTWQAWQPQQHIDIFAIHSARQGASVRQWKQRWRRKGRQRRRGRRRQRRRRRQRQRRRQRRRRGPNMCECLCQFSLLTCCCRPPCEPLPSSLSTPHSPLSSFSVLLLNFTFATQYGKCHLFMMAFWHLSLLNMFSSSPVLLFACFPIRLLLCSLILLLLFFWLPCRRQLWCIFNFAVFLAFSFASQGATSVPESLLTYPKSLSVLLPALRFLLSRSLLFFLEFSVFTAWRFWQYPSHLYWFGFCAFGYAGNQLKYMYISCNSELPPKR